MQSIGHNLNIDAWHVGGIDLNIRQVESDFPEWFYVRKESLKIFKVFKALMEAKLHVVFVGTPGAGKGMLVVLFAFYMALVQKKRVVLFRKLKGKGCTMLYLDAENEQYWRKDKAAIRDIYLLENRDFELCLDGLDYNDVCNHFETLARFRLLATPAQYPMKNNDVRLRRCIVPFWSLSDLNAIGAHREWPEQEIKDRYFYSGGNLRDFSSPKDLLRISTDQAIHAVLWDVAKLLRTQYGGGAEYRVDRLRMAGIRANGKSDLARDTKDLLKEYLGSSKWICVITSEYALRQLGKMMEPSYYKDLWSMGRMLGDDGLMDIAFENYVHALARDEKKIELQVRTYDREEVTQHTYVALAFEAKACRNDGKNAAEYDAAM
ncbi:hypothetical protein V7S43_005716 [Phytophthora oleae]|uniref:Uncharacterized protein n=1 Tax=Phytophthora oleae TaxID=2107226 RepID=A0ABD3FUR2_9STRA